MKNMKFYKVENMPFSEAKSNRFTFRKFSEDVKQKDLVWHRDKEDRKVSGVTGEAYIQFEDTLPIKLEQNCAQLIKAGRVHRLIKNQEEIIIKIEKNNG